MRTKFGRFVLNATASLGLASVSLLNAYAGDPHLSPVQPNCPYPIVPAPGDPATVTPLPGATTPTPGATTPTPGAVPDGGVGATIPAETGATTAAAPSDAGTTSATGTDMIGRSDFFNRFNLFDTQSAVPRNRVWFSFQRNENFNPSITVGSDAAGLPDAANQVTNRPTTYLYRMGAEIALSERASFSFQHQYIGVSDTDAFDPSWGDPQFMAKYAVVMDYDRVVSAILGFSPHFATSTGEIRSPRARIYPGLLFWQALGDRDFLQGGTQVGIPLANGDIPTFDYALSAGYWVYKAAGCESCGNRSLLTGIAPQVEIFGQHAFWDNRIDGAPDDFGGATAQQGRHVIDVTVGASVLLRSLIVGAGYSFPITGAEARRSEIIGSIIYRF